MQRRRDGWREPEPDHDTDRVDAVLEQLEGLSGDVAVVAGQARRPLDDELSNLLDAKAMIPRSSTNGSSSVPSILLTELMLVPSSEATSPRFSSLPGRLSAAAASVVLLAVPGLVVAVMSLIFAMMIPPHFSLRAVATS